MTRNLMIWIAFVVISLGSTWYAITYFPQVFTFVSVDIKMDRKQAIDIARALARERNWGLDGQSQEPPVRSPPGMQRCGRSTGPDPISHLHPAGRRPGRSVQSWVDATSMACGAASVHRRWHRQRQYLERCDVHLAAFCLGIRCGAGPWVRPACEV